MTARTSPWGARVVIIALIVVGVIADQVTKAIAVARLTPGVPVPLVSDIFSLTLVFNPGAAFSTGEGFTIGFAILAVAVLAGVAIWVVPKIRSWLWAVAIGLAMAGIAGNFIDRIVRSPGPFRGLVVDFFALKYFAVFNVADIMLTTAAILIVVLAVFVRIDWRGERVGRGQPGDAPGGTAEAD